jgi:hypothetical protein
MICGTLNVQCFRLLSSLFRSMFDEQHDEPTHPSDIGCLEATTWAQRNLDKATQPSREQAKLTEAQKASHGIRRQINHAKNEALTADLAQYRSECDEKLTRLAEKHSYKQEYLVCLLNTSSTFKKTQKPNLHNAIMHFKAVEKNQGSFIRHISPLHGLMCFSDAAVGEKLKLPALQNLVREDPELQDLTKEQEAKLLQMLEDHRALKATGARASNRAAAQDVRLTLQNLNTEVCRQRSQHWSSPLTFHMQAR